MNVQNRRQFLKNSAKSISVLGITGSRASSIIKSTSSIVRGAATALGGTALTGCQSVERFFMGEDRDSESRVVIVGAGLAGLTLAYELKKRKIPYVLFESKERTGGKIYSVESFDGFHAADLGASRFYSSDLDFIELLKELKIPFQETNRDWDLSKKELIRKLESFWNEIYNGKWDLAENISDLDQISATEMIQRFGKKLSSNQVQYLNQHLFSLAPNTSDVSGFWFLQNFLRQHKGPEYFIPGGLGLVTKALTQRVSGLYKDTFLNIGHELVYLDRDEEFFELKFKQQMGSEEGSNLFKTSRFAKAKYLVFASPISQVDSIQIGSQFQWPEALLKLRNKIGETSQAKIILSLQDKSFQRESQLIKNSKHFLSDGLTLYFRELENIGNKWGSVLEIEGPSELLMKEASQLNGLEKKISLFLKKDIKFQEPFFQKSWQRLYLKPQGYETLNLPYFFQDEKFHFAVIGEACSKNDFGNMNAAVQSAKLCAHWLQKKAPV